MIIIEETEEDKNRAALPDEDSFEDEELTTEEAKYRSAKDLRDSLECVERYEQGVRTLLDAAALFDEIDDYEDSARLAEKCRKKAKDYEKKGMEKAYQQAIEAYLLAYDIDDSKEVKKALTSDHGAGAFSSV